MKSSLVNALARPRIIVLTTDPAHGLAGYVAELVMALAQCGCGMPVVLFCPANYAHTEEVRAAGVDVVSTAERKTSYAGLAERLLRNISFVTKTTIAQFWLVRGRDIVHLQSTLHLPLGFAFFFVTFLRGGSVVLTAHDPLPHRWRFPLGLRWLERKMLEIAYCLSDRIIVHNETGKDVLVRELRQDSRRIFVVPHGSYSNLERIETAYPHCDCLRLLAFGSIRENKGLHLAIRAVQMISSNSHAPRLVRLTIAGRLHNAGEEGYWQSCKQLIASQPENIEVIERHIEEDEIGPLLARHHAVLLPYTEFFSESGVAVLALSHQRPIFATVTGGLGELIEQGSCGIPILSPSVDAVARAIGTAIQLGPERLQQMGIEGSRFIRRTRSSDSIARQTVEVYSELSNCNTEWRNARATTHTP
jgi:glycogen(starch) synthase